MSIKYDAFNYRYRLTNKGMLYPIYNKKCPVCDKEDLDHLILKCEKYDEYCGDIERFCLLMKSVMGILL